MRRRMSIYLLLFEHYTTATENGGNKEVMSFVDQEEAWKEHPQCPGMGLKTDNPKKQFFNFKRRNPRKRYRFKKA